MSVPAGTSLYIRVVANGEPVPRASVTVHSHQFADPDLPNAPLPPAPVFTTDGAGNLLLEDLVEGAFIAQIDAPGYATASLVLDLASGMHAGMRVNLLPLAEPIVFDADLGATLEQGGVRVDIPAGVVVDAQGEPVTGPVQMRISPFDPSQQLADLPWPLRGERSSANGGEAVQLKTLFMADIGLWRGPERLALAPGKTASVEFLLPTGLGGRDGEGYAVGDDIPSWSFDFVAGTWKEDGTGRIVPSRQQPDRLAWTADVPQMAPRNADDPVPPPKLTCVLVTVFDDEDAPVADIGVVLQTKDMMYLTQGITNADGQVCLSTPVNAPADVWVGEPNTPLTAKIEVAPDVPDATCPPDLNEPGDCYELGIPYDDPKSDDCSPGSSYECPYGGQPQDEGVGICAAGQIVCDNMKQWGDVCVGEVLPEPEECLTSDIDEDCDGVADDAPMNCACNNNAPSIPCFTDPDVQIQGACKAGHQDCEGGFWSECKDEVVSMPEDCNSPQDEDCDGNQGCGFAITAWSFGDAADQRATDVGASNTRIYVLGRYTGTVTVGGGQIQSPDEHAFLASFKLNGDGVHVIDLGGAWTGDLNLAVNPGDDIVVAGTLDGAFDSGCGALVSNGTDGAYVRYAGGMMGCTASHVFTQPDDQSITAVDIDNLGIVYLAGVYASVGAPLVLGAYVLPPTPVGERDGLVIRLDAGDVVQWATALPMHLPQGDARAPDLAAAGDAVLVSGAFQGSRDFGADTLYAAGNSDLFVTRHDATTGAIVWAENFGNEADEPGYVSIAIDAGDSFVISGMIDGKVSFGLGPQHMGGLTDTEGVFIHKRTLDNEPLWTATRLLTAPQTLAGGHSVAIDDDGRVVLVGTAAVNSADLYTIKFSATGEVYWEATHNQLGDQFGAAVAIDSTDHPIVVGRFDTDFVVDGVQIDLGDVGDIMDPFVLILQP